MTRSGIQTSVTLPIKARIPHAPVHSCGIFTLCYWSDTDSRIPDSSADGALYSALLLCFGCVSAFTFVYITIYCHGYHFRPQGILGILLISPTCKEQLTPLFPIQGRDVPLVSDIAVYKFGVILSWKLFHHGEQKPAIAFRQRGRRVHEVSEAIHNGSWPSIGN